MKTNGVAAVRGVTNKAVYRTLLALQREAAEEGDITSVKSGDAVQIDVPIAAFEKRLAEKVIELLPGLALAAEQYGASFFGNGAVAGGILQSPNE